MAEPMLSQKAASFTESAIREMTRLAQLHGAVNLAQGMPDFPAPAEIKEAACRAIMEDVISTPSHGVQKHSGMP